MKDLHSTKRRFFKSQTLTQGQQFTISDIAVGEWIRKIRLRLTGSITAAGTPAGTIVSRGVLDLLENIQILFDGDTRLSGLTLRHLAQLGALQTRMIPTTIDPTDATSTAAQSYEAVVDFFPNFIRSLDPRDGFVPPSVVQISATVAAVTAADNPFINYSTDPSSLTFSGTLEVYIETTEKVEADETSKKYYDVFRTAAFASTGETSLRLYSQRFSRFLTRLVLFQHTTSTVVGDPLSDTPLSTLVVKAGSNDIINEPRFANQRDAEDLYKIAQSSLVGMMIADFTKDKRLSRAIKNFSGDLDLRANVASTANTPYAIVVAEFVAPVGAAMDLPSEAFTAVKEGKIPSLLDAMAAYGKMRPGAYPTHSVGMPGARNMAVFSARYAKRRKHVRARSA